jgi:drug/metabolite transporter (DMT)-like permease
MTSVTLSAFAQLSLKLGTNNRNLIQSKGAIYELLTLATSPLVILGLGLYAFGALVWIFVLARLPLSTAYPFVGLGFILTMMIGAYFLNETLTATKIFGTLLIVLGCAFVARAA